MIITSRLFEQSHPHRMLLTKHRKGIQPNPNPIHEIGDPDPIKTPAYPNIKKSKPTPFATVHANPENQRPPNWPKKKNREKETRKIKPIKIIPCEPIDDDADPSS